MVEILHGDCIEQMRSMEKNRFDSIVTDPPYGLEFSEGSTDWMAGGKMARVGFGRDVPWPSFSSAGSFGAANPTCDACGGRMRGAKKCSCDEPQWRVKGVSHQQGERPISNPGLFIQRWHESWAREALRVIKPGGHMVVFGGSRMFHRLGCALEDVGWEIRDCLSYLYSSGFPKSTNMGRVTGDPAWDGWSTTLKPAWEPILLARKPMGRTVAENLKRFRTGALKGGTTQ